MNTLTPGDPIRYPSGGFSMSKKLPPDPEGMNDNRAMWALAAVRAFQEITGTDDEDAVSDLIADLYHLTDRETELGTMEAALGRAARHYEEETRTEEEYFADPNAAF